MNRITLAIGLTACFLGASKLPAQATPLDWAALARESQAVLSDYLRVNTTNPPGNEILVARSLKTILDRERIEARVLDTTERGQIGRTSTRGCAGTAARGRSRSLITSTSFRPHLLHGPSIRFLER